ncbi:MAG: ATP-binding protein [Anaerolineae bacterium]|nr:ATP-binding protein [Anaerolineae bacterium]
MDGEAALGHGYTWRRLVPGDGVCGGVGLRREARHGVAPECAVGHRVGHIQATGREIVTVTMGLSLGDTMQLDQTPAERDLAASQDWLVRLRWFAGLGVLVATWISEHILGLGLASIPIYVIGVCILAYNAVFWWWLNGGAWRDQREHTDTRLLARLQITADWVAMTLLIHFSGGIESPVLLYFLFHITLAAILLPVQDTYMFAALATLLVSGLAWVEYSGLVPHIPIVKLQPVTVYHNPAYIGGRLAFFTSTVFVSAYLATRATNRLRVQKNEMVLLSRDLQETYDRMHTLYESAQAVSSTLDFQEVLDRLTRSVTEVMSAKACSIRLLDNTGRRLFLASTYGLSEQYLQKGTLLVDQNPLVREVLDGKTIAVADITQDDRLQYLTEAVAEGIRATLTVPLLGREGPLGMIRVYEDIVYTFTESDIAFLSATASHGSIAIENAIAYRSVQSLEEAKRKFILTVTHELRSPVAVVKSLLRTLIDGYAGQMAELQQDMISRALRRTELLQSLIDDLLDLAAGRSGLGLTKDAEPIDLGDVLSKVIERYTIPAVEKQIELDLQLERDGPLKVLSTADELDRVFNNLVSNAVKYTPEDGTVTVRVLQTADEAQVEVSDTGIGIPDEALAHLFEEFYRAPNAKETVRHGTGLGLVVVKEIVTRYGGRLQVNSVLDKGTTFIVTLPLL